MTPSPQEAAPGGDSGSARILEAAARLFAEKGFDGTSISAVAARAGIGKATVFHHFGSKEALYLAVLRDACRGGAELLAQIEGSDLDVIERIRLFSVEHLRNMLGNEQGARLVLRETTGFGAAGGQVVAEEVLREHFLRLVAIVREGQANGLLRADLDAEAATVFLVSGNMLFFLTRDVLRHLPGADFADDPQRFADTVISIFLDGVRVPRTPDQG